MQRQWRSAAFRLQHSLKIILFATQTQKSKSRLSPLDKRQLQRSLLQADRLLRSIGSRHSCPLEIKQAICIFHSACLCLQHCLAFPFRACGPFSFVYSIISASICHSTAGININLRYIPGAHLFSAFVAVVSGAMCFPPCGVCPVNNLAAHILSTILQKLLKRLYLPAAFRQGEAARRRLPAVDITAFHINGVSSADIRKRVVADHQHL